MAQFPDFMDRDEAAICNKLISAIFKRGYQIRVRDCEMAEVMCDYTTNRADIQKETAATGGTLYDIRKPEGPRLGMFVLIHGNGVDVISDMAWNGKTPEMEAALDEMCEEAQR